MALNYGRNIVTYGVLPRERLGTRPPATTNNPFDPVGIGILRGLIIAGEVLASLFLGPIGSLAVAVAGEALQTGLDVATGTFSPISTAIGIASLGVGALSVFRGATKFTRGLTKYQSSLNKKAYSAAKSLDEAYWEKFFADAFSMRRTAMGFKTKYGYYRINHTTGEVRPLMLGRTGRGTPYLHKVWADNAANYFVKQQRYGTALAEAITDRDILKNALNQIGGVKSMMNIPSFKTRLVKAGIRTEEVESIVNVV